jgi:hypothetical protein
MAFSKGNIPIMPFKKGHIPVNKGIPMSEEQKKKISERFKGKPLPENALKRCREVNLGNDYHKGKKMSESARQKISAALKGRKFTEEHKRKIGSANKGKKRTSEQCKINSAVHKGLQAKDKNPRWKGGISFEPYCPKFTKEFKERVRSFFNHTCQFPDCNHVWKEGERKLAVHHVNFDKQVCCNTSIPLFVPLCNSCHMKTQTDRNYYEEYFTKLINEKYGGKCYFPKTSKI